MSIARDISRIINSTGDINLTDNIIVLNSDEAGVPSSDAGIEVERGTETNKTLLWDETNDRWTIGTEIMVGQTFNALSDINLKENVKPLESALDKVNNLNGVSFNWKHSGNADIGFIAQEVENVLPELVKTSNVDDIKSVSYQNVVAVLVEAIKEQQVMIEELQAKLGN